MLAKSIPAKKFKVKTGEPISMALRKCPSLVIAPPDFKLYSACSKAFKDICRGYAPVVEEFSIDECFCDFTGTRLTYPDPIALAHEIKDRIRDELGFTVNVGIGRNKLCAKMASDFEKPDKVHTLFPDEIPEKLWPLPVGDLLFVGGRSVEKLEKAYIRTIGDLARSAPEHLKPILGEKFSRQAWRYANGIDDSPVRAEPEEAKGYSNSVTLEENVTDLETANAILLALCDCQHRCVWTHHGQRREVWRCASRIDYGSKYCKHSPTLDEKPLQNTILAAINSVMRSKTELISDITAAMQMEMSPAHRGQLSVGDLDRAINNEDLTAHAEEFKRITDTLAELKERKKRLLKQQSENAAANQRVAQAASFLESQNVAVTEWDESMIRQLIDTVRVLSADRIRVCFHGGIEIEQDMVNL